MRIAKLLAEFVGAGLTVLGLVASLWIGVLLAQATGEISPMEATSPRAAQVWGLPLGQVLITVALITLAGLVLMWLPRARRR